MGRPIGLGYTYWTHFAWHGPEDSVLVTDEDEIVEIGTASLLAHRGSRDRLADCEGAFLTPGLWDSHVHLLAYGKSFRELYLDADLTYDEVLARVRHLAHTMDTREALIWGAGWSDSQWGIAPKAADLSRVAEGHPVALISHDHHSVWLSQEAMATIGLERHTPPVPGGVIERDIHGVPTGVVRENQVTWVYTRLTSQSPDDDIRDLKRGLQEMARHGIVGVTSMESREGFIALQRIMGESYETPIRVDVMLPKDQLTALAELGVMSRFGHSSFRIQGVKLFIDGALGSRTAWMKNPYEGEPENCGVLSLEPDLVRSIVEAADKAGLAVAMHAIGDRAVQIAVKVLRDFDRPRGVAHRIEHAQLMDDTEIPWLTSRFALSVQPVHMVDDYTIARRHWGERSLRAYRFQSFWQQGGLVLLGSDAPVATPDPRWGLWMAVHRAPFDRPREVWNLQEALTPRQALDGYTRVPAIANARRSGVLAPGFQADFTFWASNPERALAEGNWDALRVVGTVVQGRQVWWNGR